MNCVLPLVRRALLATLLLARGRPRLCTGNEIGKRRQGKHNAWNQYSPTGRLDWKAAKTALQTLAKQAWT